MKNMQRLLLIVLSSFFLCGTAYASTKAYYCETGDDANWPIDASTKRLTNDFEAITGAEIMDTVSFYGTKLSSPGTCTIDLMAADGSHKPTGSVLATASLNANSYTASPAWVTSTSFSAYTMTVRAKYLFRISCPSATGANYVLIRDDSTSPACFTSTVPAWSTDSGANYTAYTTDSVMFRGYANSSAVPATTGGSIETTTNSGLILLPFAMAMVMFTTMGFIWYIMGA